MHIENIGSSRIAHAGAPPPVPEEGERAGRKPVQEVSRVPATDRVEISEEGRVLAAHAEIVAWLEAEAGLSPEKVAAVLRRLREGAYHTPEVAREVARRLLESGDL
jgi:hypothetical protein